VSYHNDLHASDVAQMTYYFFKTTDLDKIAELNHLDMVSVLTAAACHDFDHDGFTNTYHVSMMTERSVRYHDEAVQENYHTAEAMAILIKPHYNFLQGCSTDEIKIFRKRMIGLILSTDMSKHMSDLASFKNKCDSLEITKEANNGNKLINHDDSSALFDSQQQILELVFHGSDVSNPTRSFELA
jgi:hypothetical protein